MLQQQRHKSMQSELETRQIKTFFGEIESDEWNKSIEMAACRRPCRFPLRDSEKVDRIRLVRSALEISER